MPGKPRATTLVSKTVNEWAFLIWPYLLAAAKNRQTINYHHLSDLMNWGGSSQLGPVLWRILIYCKRMKKGRVSYPLLPCIVVNPKSGKPGDGSPYESIDIDSEREKVFNFNWYEITLPTPADFADNEE